MKFWNPATEEIFPDFNAVYFRMLGELGVADRHLERLHKRTLPLSETLIEEIQASIYRAKVLVSQMIPVSDEWQPPTSSAPTLFEGTSGSPSESAAAYLRVD
jgi:hypothetical protein